MLDGVTVIESNAQKDEIILQGNDIQNVSQSGMFIVFYQEIDSSDGYFFEPHPYRALVVSGTKISERFVTRIFLPFVP